MLGVSSRVMRATASFADAHAAAHESGGESEQPTRTTSLNDVAVTPRGDFGPKRLSDSNELQPLAELRQANVVRRVSEVRRAKASLAIVDRLPSLLDRREVPPRAAGRRSPTAVPSPDRTRDAARRGTARPRRSCRATRCRTGRSCTCSRARGAWAAAARSIALDRTTRVLYARGDASRPYRSSRHAAVVGGASSE